MSWPLAIVLAFALSGCATTSPLRLHLPTGSETKVKNTVAFVPMDPALCGPIVLKMAVEYHRPTRPLSVYRDLTFLEKLRGTLKTDMISASRRLSLSPYRVPSSDELIREVAQGQPVVVFQNLGLSWLP